MYNKYKIREQMFGSLNQFIDGQNKTTELKHHENDDQLLEPVSPISKYSRKKMLEIRRKRTMSGVDSYKASDKSLLFKKFAENYPQLQKAKRENLIQKQQKIVNERKPLSTSRISSLFAGQYPNKMKDQIAKDRLKREHNLLRAIVRTKAQQQQKISNTQYEDSFNRLAIGLKNIKIKAVTDNEKRQYEDKIKTNRSMQTQNKPKAKSTLKNQTRLQFENCLSWSKRRKKDGSFYAQKLGKNVKYEIERDQSFENRKSMLQFIHHRSQSLDFPSTT